MPIAALDKVSIETTFHPLKIQANPTLMEILLNNLFQNAVRHTVPEGQVNIAIRDSWVRVSNTGGPLKIPPSEMFERFKKDSKNENSVGLGLAIIRKICDTNGYGLEYRYESGSHIFVIALK